MNLIVEHPVDVRELVVVLGKKKKSKPTNHNFFLFAEKYSGFKGPI